MNDRCVAFDIVIPSKQTSYRFLQSRSLATLIPIIARWGHSSLIDAGIIAQARTTHNIQPSALLLPPGMVGAVLLLSTRIVAANSSVPDIHHYRISGVLGIGS